MEAGQELVRGVRAGLAALADPVRAADMRRYLKSAMPCDGVPTPARRALARRLFAEHPLADHEAWLATALALWRGADRREQRYVAVDLLGHRPYAAWRTQADLPVYEELIVTGAWWDHVDELASRHVGPLVLAHPTELAPVMRSWSTDPDRWKRRTSVICQLGAKDRTDARLLADCVEANIADRDFFLRKGIGWALRQYARTDPGWVLAFVAAHPDLSPLSRREATRRLTGPA